MKIVFLHMTLGLADRGSEISTLLLAGHLSKTEEVHTISTATLKSKSFIHHQINNIKNPPNPEPKNFLEKAIFRLSLDENSWQVKIFTRRALPLIRELEPDIIIPVNGHLQLRIIKSAIPQVKTATFGHAGIGYHDYKTLMGKPDLFIALTREAEIWARSVTPTLNITYIPNPIDLSLYNKSKPAKLSLQRPTVLAVSALTPYKNILNVIKATKLAGFSLLLVGSGISESTIVSTAKSLLSERFIHITRVDHHDLPPYYRAADIFCHVPEPQEAFGRVYLEAMATGLPIVATDDPIRREIVGNQGFYVDPYNINNISSALTEASREKQLSYTDQVAKFDIKSVTKKVRNELKKI